jgi:hypothetical protein
VVRETASLKKNKKIKNLKKGKRMRLYLNLKPKCTNLGLERVSMLAVRTLDIPRA